MPAGAGILKSKTFKVTMGLVFDVTIDTIGHVSNKQVNS